ncbi:unnamed protein product [Candida verbasci]|uniref:Calcineurin-like phosphoesterase domain-containing protein n=1 Tax=Candida verbasci TaxID=1227364 RepID=A0A9W4U1M8_9ASCO|nr:unnamed protein product [Candida verbasci]
MIIKSVVVIVLTTVLFLTTPYFKNFIGFNTISDLVVPRPINHKDVARPTNHDLTDEIIKSLDIEETSFIYHNLDKLSKLKGNKCDQCKQRMKFAKSLIDENPDMKHLITLMLHRDHLREGISTYDWFKIYQNFFVTTNSQNFIKLGDNLESGYSLESSINFFDNDFLNLIKHFNLSSDLDLEYYCYFREHKACELPKTPNLQELINIESWFPAKDPKYGLQPSYKNNSEIFNVLHVSDFHLQLRYQVGSEANCTNLPCALPESFNEYLPDNYNFTTYNKNLEPSTNQFEFSFYPRGKYDNLNYTKGEYFNITHYLGWDFHSSPATPFGAYLADAPEILINSSLIDMAKLHKEKNFEIFLFTGDLVDHDGIHCTANVTKYVETRVFNLIKNYLHNMTIIPSLGNHDSYPYGQVAPLEFDEHNHYQYNTEEIIKNWINNEWFDEKDANDLKKHYSGFSYITNRGLKIISLNSNAYFRDNLWAYIDQTTKPDLFGQWKFLIDELVESEKNNQRVWILAHVPPNTDTLPIQSHIFARIIKRFSPYTIAHLFFGHTHRDHFSILYDVDSIKIAKEENVVNMAYIAQSVSPFKNFNPSFKWYEVETESFNIRNSYNQFTKLNDTFVNDGNEPIWEYEYSARELYDPNHEWPKNAPLNGTFWHRFVVEILLNTDDIEFAQKFINHQYRLSPLTPKCDNNNKLSNECYNENNCYLNFHSDDVINCLRSN